MEKMWIEDWDNMKKLRFDKGFRKMFKLWNEWRKEYNGLKGLKRILNKSEKRKGVSKGRWDKWRFNWWRNRINVEGKEGERRNGWWDKEEKKMFRWRKD